MATATQIANNITTLSPEHRIIRYVVKMWRNRNNPAWTNDVNVKKVLTSGNLDVAKIRNHFVDRGIVTATEFNDAIQRGVQAGVLTNDLKSVGQTLLDVNDIIEARVLAENEEAQAQRDAERLATLPANDRDALKGNYSARAQEILATLT